MLQEKQLLTIDFYNNNFIFLIIFINFNLIIINILIHYE
jgi:hypothetical protein